MKEFQFTPADIERARQELAPVLRKTPVLESQSGEKLWFKPESLQVTGSFKIRPAYLQLARLSDRERRQGVVTSSSGNFALGVAYASRLLGVSAKIVMMRSANALKARRTRELGAEIVFCEDRFEARAETVENIRREEGRTPIHPYNHPHAILGNTSLGAEIAEQAAAVRNVVVPVSGGGLIAGILTALSQLRPEIAVWGVQAEGSDATYLSFRQKHPVRIDKARTIADGLMVTEPGSLTFPILLDQAAGVVTVSERSILDATSELLHREHLVVEPSGAVTLAAVREGRVPSDATLCVLSGGNISTEILERIVEI
ncbi:MAG: threonine/serine dehydratase [Acidobacteriota bacterium]|jgi:threonine dehydratase